MTSVTGGGGEDYVEGGIKRLTASDPTLIGPYLLLGRLGAGGMGRVYLARSESGRTAAVKVVHEEHVSDSRFRARFRREIGAARKVDQRYTAPVLDADPDAEFPWVATGYVPGLSLEQVVRGHGPLPAEAVHALTEGLLRALHDIHGAGIVHRDLKPSNVMLTVDGPRIIDFGIARAVQTSVESMLTSTGMVVGSPGFMAPEQILGEASGPKCDVFALGCLIVYAATGQLPFGHAAGNQHAVMYRIVEGEPELDGLRDEELRALAARCLTKDVGARPGVDELLADPRRTAALPSADSAHLPGPVVTHLAQQAARLLDAEAATPVREEEPSAVREEEPSAVREEEPSAVREGSGPAAGTPADRDTAKLRPAAAAATVPPGGAATRERDSARRRRWWSYALPVVAVLALGGGTIALLGPFGGNGEDEGAPPADGGSTATAGPGSPASPSGSPSGKGEKTPDGKGKDVGGKKDDGKGGAGTGDGEDGDSADGGGSAADKGGGTDASGGGSGDGGGSGSGSGSGSSEGGSGSTGGGSAGAVPSYFVDSWAYADQYNIGQPGTITVSGGGTVRLVVKGNGIDCTYSAKVTSTANEGSRIDLGTQTLSGGTPGPCHATKDPSYLTISGGGVRYVPGPSHGDGYRYTRG
ncbi:serine/threonine-protein kinase [Streptomyces luteolus]|uniref:non-specific serine/threonine protein kinase n=1 Tax=Streptomyces luteolus TaxID=3043615 RepID=A0ABT6SYV6_9ACTN|nr:serine/threonine-protein kinase [Streptomyces sp. B-S-A12]MDI3420009.1 serine/threonine-protein kinase [Streptomyces sp. B-S-A12]